MSGSVKVPFGAGKKTEAEVPESKIVWTCKACGRKNFAHWFMCADCSRGNPQPRKEQ